MILVFHKLPLLKKWHLVVHFAYLTADRKKVEMYRAFIASLKALPVVLDYEEHDHVTGTISHLPHIVAANLVNFVHDTDTKKGLMKSLAVGGFKDIPRIASSSPVMWQQICLKNKDNSSCSYFLSNFNAFPSVRTPRFNSADHSILEENLTPTALSKQLEIQLIILYIAPNENARNIILCPLHTGLLKNSKSGYFIIATHPLFFYLSRGTIQTKSSLKRENET